MRAGMGCSSRRAAATPLLDTAHRSSPDRHFLRRCWSLPFVPLPLTRRVAVRRWRRCVIHFGYYLTLAQAYRTGDLSFAYPLMRGTAPLLVTLLGIVFLRELPTAQVSLGILLISAGIVGIAFAQRHHHPRAAVYWALANAAIIAVYTLVDGAGARASGNALAYVVWLSFLEGVVFLCLDPRPARR